MDISVDVLIVGTGAAGLYAALNLNEDLNVLLITKESVDKCNTSLAQGGIAVAKDEKDFDLFVQDTLKAGKYKNSMEAVKTLVYESIDNINEVVDFGAEFDKVNENFKYTKEGAHSTSRIVHTKDETGKELFLSLLAALKNKKNVRIFENTTLLDLITKDNICFGGTVIRGKERINIYSREMILATGGIGGLFKNSTSRRRLTGDGIAIALRHDIKTSDLNYVQFHPTALYDDKVNCEKFLISESLRGEGAKLLNECGERFVDELLPRDVVAKAVYKEEEKSNKPYVFLDISFKGKEYIIDRFPGIYKKCLECGIDITKNKIPVTPVQHYHMGGIAVDLDSKTSMDHLFACGEVSCTGVHGANRLASNSLLEALVFSRRASRFINKSICRITTLNCDDINSIKSLSDYSEINKAVVLNKFKEMGDEIRNELVNY
ncbi:L-aspartate oxidase [Clostridium estertheticum]|uniref:L-aspartate oxidase n=1 Tax=Clostridium estertheticum TaxID=238834 RepID=UPI001C6F1A06|nr:L-aspartate oxidase [Clostridium estertheticum]MBW9152075.1 L-aspartate oxidase [Clostridium estertheticum]WLC85104.1 L-aspartate oxidase [Clostridium estertheticum]